MSMIVQFQGPNGPIFVHRDNIVTIATTPQLGLMTKGRPSSTTVLTLDTGATLTINDDPLHAAEKWEKAFAEDFDDLDDAFSDDDESEREHAEMELLLALLDTIGDDHPNNALPGVPTRLRQALIAWRDVVDAEAADDDEEDDDADA